MDAIANKTKIAHLFHRYLEYGAFPEVAVSDQKKEILLAYFDDLVQKDLVRRFKIRKYEPLKSLVKYYLSTISSLSTFNSVSRFLTISVDTIEKYTGYLEQIFLVFSVKRFSAKVKVQEKSPKKIYSIDVGLSNTLGFKLFNNYGLLLENLVFLELKREQMNNPAKDIFYWKDNEHREVDFIIRNGLEITDLIQVCRDPTDVKTKKREVQGVEKAMIEFHIQNAVIITGDYKAEIETNTGTIQCIPFLQWIMNR
jgi:predicted AAA+ superfamily ATPase